MQVFQLRKKDNIIIGGKVRLQLDKINAQHIKFSIDKPASIKIKKHEIYDPTEALFPG
ncbi:MAG: carbon storage regulator [Pseudomonadales bacterium]|nr:carbon storage regulator [Pseudomonadales bacterium]